MSNTMLSTTHADHALKVAQGLVNRCLGIKGSSPHKLVTEHSLQALGQLLGLLLQACLLFLHGD